ncbi:unnamed protein product [Mesocestoides corti]|uniref:Apple domain-containing protein n=1 Tax=Mesocestoides corti TaxID=53468 RepID=A0A0R3UIG1_MESCO|nr:unnamed protein product [Mesocestoides corti]
MLSRRHMLSELHTRRPCERTASCYDECERGVCISWDVLTTQLFWFAPTPTKPLTHLQVTTAKCNLDCRRVLVVKTGVTKPPHVLGYRTGPADESFLCCSRTEHQTPVHTGQSGP